MAVVSLQKKPSKLPIDKSGICHFQSADRNPQQLQKKTIAGATITITPFRIYPKFGSDTLKDVREFILAMKITRRLSIFQ